jgi:thiol-disulfide isomerase/thioredoxin
MVTEITMHEMLTPQVTPDNSIHVVMFYGPTCGPCKATMPNYELVANLFEGKPIQINFFKINAWEPVEQLQFCKETYGINGVPHFKVFCRGEEIKQKSGGGDEPIMREFINDAIYEATAKFQRMY